MRRFRRPVGRSAVLQFAISGLVATLVIGLIAVAVGRHAGTNEAIRNAKQVTRLAGEGIVEPSLSRAAIAGDPAALRRLDAVVRDRVMRHGVVRVKIWTADGKIVYSDQPRLIGRRFELGEEQHRALASKNLQGDVSDLTGAENTFEQGQGKLLEVYLPIWGPNGQTLLFEAYQRFASVSASGGRMWTAFAPALLGGLLLLQLVNLPLARSLARRVQRGQEEREALLHRALDASQTERRTIAADLHDGVVQDLLAVSYALDAEADDLNGSASNGSGLALRAGATQTRDSVRALRTLLVEIYPPNLHQAGLASALEDLAETYTARGLPTKVDIAARTDPSEATERLLFRCGQEGLRNAFKHADATEARLWLRPDGDRIVMDIVDDGRGFDPGHLTGRPDNGHLGMRLIADLVADAGGHVDVLPSPGGGTTIRMEVPT